MKGTINLSGFEEYFAQLREAEGNIDGVARDATYETAVVLQEEMRSLVPVLTGRLHEHILIDGPHTEGNIIWCEVGIIHKIEFTPKDVAIQANVIEYGSPSKHIQPEPFIRPAIDHKRKVLKNTLKTILRKYGIIVS